VRDPESRTPYSYARISDSSLRFRLGIVTVVATFLCAGCRPATDPADPPTAGKVFDLSFEDFVETVEPILIKHGCDLEGDCHGGGIRGTFVLSPPDLKDPVFDFEQVQLQVLPHDITNSPILTKPLEEEAGGTPHSSEPFASKEDPDYSAIDEWIRRGEFR